MLKRITTFDLGDIVLCDLCNKDYTDSTELGGFIFGSNAVCPACAPRFKASIRKHNETASIRATAKENQAFRDFVREYRGGPATTTIISWE